MASGAGHGPDRMTTVCVVPTNRPERLHAWQDAWRRADWDALVIVEDAPTCTVGTFAWQEIQDVLGDDAWIISRRDSAIRCFGFLEAVRRWKADLVLTLDDDCLPDRIDALSEGHSAALSGHRRWTEAIPHFRTRGLPYRNLGRLDTVAVNVGLWVGVADRDAPHSLVTECVEYRPPPGRWLVPAGQYVPMCGMNLAFRRDVLPLMYFPLMGDGQPYRRFDDIWCGIIAKKCMDHLGLQMSIGEPWVRHERASDPFVNLEREAPGIRENETFWETIDRIELTARQDTPTACTQKIAWHLQRTVGEYWQRLGKALAVWSVLAAEALGE